MYKTIAVDYGASSGRVMLGSFDGERVKLTELHRFSNDPVYVGDHLYWDVLRLFHELKQGMREAVRQGHRDVCSIGTDTWGVDFGLLDENGDILGNPCHYRDSRTEGMIEATAAVVPQEEIYGTTGIAFQTFNTLYQLQAMVKANSPLLDKAKSLLFMPDLFNYLLSGVRATEFTIASTSQMLDARNRSWALPMLQKLGIPTGMLLEVIEPCTVLGPLTEAVAKETGLERIPVIAVAGHDTGSAVISVPAEGNDHAYLSSGTWSLMGLEMKAPVLTERVRAMNFTNEGGVAGTTRFIKNIMGLWIYQEIRRSWNTEGSPVTFPEMEAEAQKAPAFTCFIEPDDDTFYSPGNMPEKIVAYLQRTGQTIPSTRGGLVRCVMESLAMKYRLVYQGLEEIAGKRLNTLHIVGGGCQNQMLNQFTADALGRTVQTGPVEATALGNIIGQLMALGVVKDLTEARQVIRKSAEIGKCEPQDTQAWDAAYEIYLHVTQKGSK